MRFVSIVLLCVVAVLESCNNSTNSTVSETSPAPDTITAKSDLDSVATGKLITVLDRYCSLKEDITYPSGPGAKSPADLLAATNELMGYLRADSSADHEILACLDTISNEATAINNLYDETGERKRIHFGVISSALYGLLKKVDLKNVTIYRMYSNNAFNDKGAYWLSSDKEIRNPYFGKKLLEQGEIVDTLK